VTSRYRIAVASAAVVVAVTTGCTPEASDTEPPASEAAPPAVTAELGTPLSADLRDGEDVILAGAIQGTAVDVPQVGSASFAVYVRCEGGDRLSIVYEGPSSPFEAPCDGIPTRVEVHLESGDTPLSIKDAQGKTGEYVIARI
jgi:hypothetical protein